MNNIPVSVIVATYNAEKYIRKCIDSILAQTLHNIEIIIIDDGSNDSSGTLIDDLARQDRRIIALHNGRNMGVSYTRQRGIETANGTYTIHIDPDDYVDCDMLECMYNAAISDNADVVICDMVEETSQGETYSSQRPSSLSPKGIIGDLLSRRLHGSCCNKLIARSIYTTGNISFPMGHGSMEDMYVCLSVFNRASRVAYIPRAFYHYYRKNEVSITTLPTQPDILRKDGEFLKLVTDIFNGDTAMQQSAAKGLARHLFLRAFYSKTLTSCEFRKIYGSFARLMLGNPYIGFPQRLIFFAACKGLYRISIPLNNLYIRLWQLKHKISD